MDDRSCHEHGGFTLIELLVVIAIIAILAAILFPVFAKAREKAYVTTCTSNQKQIAASILMYVQEHDEIMPDAKDWSSAIGGGGKVFDCPSSSHAGTDGDPDYLYIAGNATSGSTTLNTFLSHAALGDIPDAAMTPMLTDRAVITDSSLPNLKNPYVVHAADYSDAFANLMMLADRRHTGGSVVGYADGHVAFVKDLTKAAFLPSFVNVPGLANPLGVGQLFMTSIPFSSPVSTKIFDTLCAANITVAVAGNSFTNFNNANCQVAATDASGAATIFSCSVGSGCVGTMQTLVPKTPRGHEPSWWTIAPTAADPGTTFGVSNATGSIASPGVWGANAKYQIIPFAPSSTSVDQTLTIQIVPNVTEDTVKRFALIAQGANNNPVTQAAVASIDYNGTVAPAIDMNIGRVDANNGNASAGLIPVRPNTPITIKATVRGSGANWGGIFLAFEK